MNIQQIQFNRQKVAALLLAGLILAATAGLAWTGADASGSTSQPIPVVQDCAYSPQADHTGPSAEVGCPGADFSGGDSELPWPYLRSVKGRKGGGNAGEF